MNGKAEVMIVTAPSFDTAPEATALMIVMREETCAPFKD
jgi:hypothetical protein